MGLCKPSFLGRIKVAAGENNALNFTEIVSSVPTPRLATITAGEHYPGDLETEIGLAMSAASGTSTFTAARDPDTGVFSITSNTNLWNPAILASDTASLWTGGATSIGAQGFYHIGWQCAASSPADALVQSGDTGHAIGWYPDQPVQDDDQGLDESSTVECWTMGGSGVAYDFSGDTGTAADPAGFLSKRRLSFRLMNNQSRLQYEAFWRHYAKQGANEGRFIFYLDRADPLTFEFLILTGESIKGLGFSRSVAGLPYWDLEIETRKYKT